MSKKGLSFDEKQDRLLAAMREKEIEKLAPGRGIVVQSVKQVLQSLVDDGKVQSDKVGSQNIFWSLASGEAARLEREAQELEKLSVSLSDELTEMTSKVEALNLQEESCPAEERRKLLCKLKGQQETLAELEAAVGQLRRTDRTALRECQEQIALAKRGIARWTDNLCIVRQWVGSRTGSSESALNRDWDMWVG